VIGLDDGMNRRHFLRLASALGATPVLAPPATRAADPPLTNWAGNLVYSTNSLSSAVSLDDVRRAVRGREHMKVLGSRHCFNPIADSRDHLLSDD